MAVNAKAAVCLPGTPFNEIFDNVGNGGGGGGGGAVPASLTATDTGVPLPPSSAAVKLNESVPLYPGSGR